jgi:adenylylsulfate kinase
MTKHLQRYRSKVSRTDRQALNGHSAAVFWLTGLSGSGKSTIAHEIEKRLHDRGMHAYVLDGDNVRHGLCGDLSFSAEARTENIRRIAEVCKLLVDSGTICLCAFISPTEKNREKVREIVGKDYREIYVKCSLAKCESRDTKGYYKMAREGKIENYTGISSPYTPPTNPDLILETETKTVEDSAVEFERYILATISCPE